MHVILQFIAPKTEDDAQCFWHCYWHGVGKVQLTATYIIERSQLPAQLSITSMALFSLPDIFVVRECHVTSDIDDKLLEFWILINLFASNTICLNTLKMARNAGHFYGLDFSVNKASADHVLFKTCQEHAVSAFYTKTN